MLHLSVLLNIIFDIKQFQFLQMYMGIYTINNFLDILSRMFSNSLFNVVLLSDNENLPPKGHILLFMICIRHFHILGLGHR